ncbi:OmpH family outer membrane protein [Gracilimonas tropica]|uniref:OmpH family outer membrane protein n=1 Tax=Gracilimonas tropica TaxID=454600 RepID=UPI00037827D1|nr:OmpH family outer membrane protein [Gracilimonas tropica]
MKKLTAIVLFISVFSIQDAFAQVKIGYTNPARILSQLPQVQEVDQQIQALIEQRDQELGERASQLQQEFANYEQAMSALSQQERSSREAELMEKNQQFEQQREGMMNEIRQKRSELMAPIIEQMNTAMQEVAEEMGLDLILNEGTSYGDSIIFFAESESLDVTDEILAKLN